VLPADRGASQAGLHRYADQRLPPGYDSVHDGGHISFTAAAGGTEYRAIVKHKDRAERDRHVELGFHDGWGTVTAQLATLVERQGA
jgi:uncharacterized protein YndB with AHSA1/START domain